MRCRESGEAVAGGETIMGDAFEFSSSHHLFDPLSKCWLGYTIAGNDTPSISLLPTSDLKRGPWSKFIKNLVSRAQSHGGLAAKRPRLCICSTASPPERFLRCGSNHVIKQRLSTVWVGPAIKKLIQSSKWGFCKCFPKGFKSNGRPNQSSNQAFKAKDFPPKWFKDHCVKCGRVVCIYSNL